MTSRRYRFVCAVAAGVLVLGSCGASSAGSDRPEAASDSVPSATPTTAGRQPVVVGPIVGAKTVDGVAFDAATVAGRPTVMWFWAPWCTICRAEAPDIVATVARYRDRVNFLGIAGRGQPRQMRAFVADTGTAGFVHLDDSGGEIWAAYGVYAQPAFAFITTTGQVRTFTGSLAAHDLSEIIEQLIVT